MKKKRLKSGVLERNFSLLKLTVGTSADYLANKVRGTMQSEEQRESDWQKFLVKQSTKLSKELGELKGSLAKVGQMIAVWGEYFLPEEAMRVLRSLHNQNPPIDWSQVEKIYLKELSEQQRHELEVETEPLGSASIGQVHLATIKSTQEKIALKIQYPGIKRAIDSDLKTLKKLLSMMKVLPKGEYGNELFREIRAMLQREADYTREAKHTIEFADLLKCHEDYLVPTVKERYSSPHILATSFMDGIPVESWLASSPSQEERNHIGRATLELFFMELFEWGYMQSDPHFGNYLIQPDKRQLILLDFGAVRKFPKEFLRKYYRFVGAMLSNDREEMHRALKSLGLLEDTDSERQRNYMMDICSMIMEPYSEGRMGAPDCWTEDGSYRWGKTNLPHKLAKESGKAFFTMGLRPPPRETVFLDRKLAGTFVFLSKLDVELDPKPLLEKYLEIGKKRLKRIDSSKNA